MSQERSPRLAARAGLIATGTLASRILGALRDAVIAAVFPLVVTDVFWLAFVIPNSLRMILAEGAMSGAFVPVFTDVDQKRGPAEAKRFAERFSGAMIVILAGVSLVGILFAPYFAMAFAAGYADRPDVWSDTIATTRIVFPYILLMGIAALMTGALQARGRFTAGAFAPSLLNVSFVLAPVVFLPIGRALGWSGTTVLSVAAIVGGSLHVLALLPSLRAADLLFVPKPAFRDPDVKRALSLLAPLVVGLGVYQLNVAISRQFLSHEPDGAMSYLYYAQRLVEIPQGMFALAVGSAALPSVAQTMARGDLEAGKGILRSALRLTLFVAIPSSVALVVLATPIVAALFGHGRFGAEAVAETSRSLVLQGLGIASVSAVRTIVPMFHGMKDTRSPVLASASNLIVFAGSAAALVPTMGHAGVALALTLAATVQLVLLLVLLRMRVGSMGLGGVVVAVARITLASAAAGVAMWLVARVDLGPISLHPLGRFAVLALAGAAGAVVFVAAAKMLGLEEVERLHAGLRRKLGRGRTETPRA